MEKMENDDISVSIKTVKVSGKLTIHIPLILMLQYVLRSTSPK